MKQIPSKIYLQFHGQERSELPDTDLEQYDEQSEVTWCEDRVNDTDVEYQRVERPRKQEEQALEDAIANYGRSAVAHFHAERLLLLVKANAQTAFKDGAKWMRRYLSKVGER